LTDEEIAERRAALEAASGGEVMVMSGVARTGMTDVCARSAPGSTPTRRAARDALERTAGMEAVSVAQTPRLAKRGGWW
jgi:GTP-binding protein